MNRPWMPLYVDDYLRDTNGLTTLEHGAYMLLIMEYWRHGELPGDERRIARIARLTDREWKKVRASLLPLFRDGWKHKRVDEELAKAEQISDRRRAAAEESWNRRNANVPAKSDANAQANAQANADANEDANTHTRALSRDTVHNSHTSETNSDVRRAKRATRLPDDWILPSGYRQWAVDRGYSDEVIDREAERMANWSRGSKGGAKLDWFATWRNWIMDKPKDALARAGPNGAAKRIPAVALFEQQRASYDDTADEPYIPNASRSHG